MKHLRLKQKILIFTGLIFLILVGIIMFVIIPSLRYIYSIKNTIELTEARMEEQYQRIRLLKKSINELSLIKTQTTEFDHVRVKTGDELSVVRNLERLAEEKKVSQQFKLSTSENGKNLVFNFNVNGTFKNLIPYIRSLETFEYYMAIEKMTFGKSPKEATGNITLTFTGTVFRQ